MARARRGGAGGIRGLVAELNAHGEAIDADLQREYGLSVADVTAGRVTLRRLAGLLRGMPLDGTAVWRDARRNKPMGKAKVVDPPPEWWSAERDYMASIDYHLRVLAWQQTEDGHKGINPPQPPRRPGAAPTPVRKIDPVERKARLLKMAGRNTTAA